MAPLRTTARIALVAGAAASAALFLVKGQRTPPFLLAIMAVWVFAPFLALGWAHMAAKRWTTPAQTALYWGTIALALGSVGVYWADAIWPRSEQAAFVFVMVPPVSSLLVGALVGGASFVSSRRSG